MTYDWLERLSLRGFSKEIQGEYFSLNDSVVINGYRDKRNILAIVIFIDPLLKQMVEYQLISLLDLSASASSFLQK